MVDDQMPLIGIPSFIKAAGPSSKPCTHYFVSVRPAAGPDSDLPTDAPDTAAHAGSALMLSTTLTRRAPSVSSDHVNELYHDQ